MGIVFAVVAGLLIAGGLLLTIGAIAGYKVGRTDTSMEGIQLRVTNSELMAKNKDQGDQIEALRDFLSMMHTDMRLPHHFKLLVEEKGLPLATPRKRLGDKRGES